MRTLLLTIITSLLCSCSYLQDRSSDFGDMLNVGVEGGTVAASVQLSNQVVGFGGPSTLAPGYGGMNGLFGKYYVPESNFWMIENSEDPSDPTVFPFFHRENPNEDSLAMNPEFKDTWVKYWHVEANLTFIGGARVGVNIAEILDFVLGFTMLDIADDDVSSEEWPY